MNIQNNINQLLSMAGRAVSTIKGVQALQTKDIATDKSDTMQKEPKVLEEYAEPITDDYYSRTKADSGQRTVKTLQLQKSTEERVLNRFANIYRRYHKEGEK